MEKCLYKLKVAYMSYCSRKISSRCLHIRERGLIYRVEIDDDRNVAIDMTLTAPGCPVAGEMPGWVENAVAAVPGVQAVTVNMTFDPPWDQSRMSDEARVALDMW